MTTPILEVRSLVCGYDERPVLRGVSFALAPGEFLGVIGPNGSGKSTLIKALTGLLPPQGGEVLLAGMPVASYPPREVARRVAVVPQTSHPAFAFTVREVVEMGRHPYLGRFATPGSEDRQAVDEALALTDLLDLQHRPVDHLSGGEFQRVTIARALAQRPAVLLLDEPTAHLDIGHQLAIFDLLARLHVEQNLAVLCVSHDLNLAAEYCQRLLLLSIGTVYAEGAPTAVITQENLLAVYGTLVRVAANPHSGQPMVLINRDLPVEEQEEEA
ncbi:MAG: Hemin import ATP-binding protein HmuV [bacterium ADurb.Bin429]|nr:MAG: Hemin import ATP-binding protein HmuV [bacterium ADurb.Bin429]